MRPSRSAPVLLRPGCAAASTSEVESRYSAEYVTDKFRIILSPQLIPAFDFGTSPHGLSAYLNETFRKPPCGISPFSAKQGFTERNISFAIFQLASTINNY